MSGLLILTHPDQVADALLRRAGGSSEVRLVTGDLATAAALERQGIPFVEEWSYLDNAVLARTTQQAHELAASWWGPALGQLEFHGVRLPHLARQELVWPLQACLNAAHVYRQLLLDVRPDRIAIYGRLEQVLLRTGPAPAFTAAASVAHAVLRWLAADQGIAVEDLALGVSRSTRLPAMPPTRLRTRMRPIRPQQGRRTILLVDAGLRPAEAEILRERLPDGEEWALAHLPVSDIMAGGPLAGARISSELAARMAAAWSAFWRDGRGDDQHPEIFANPFLRFQFEGLRREIEAAVQLGEGFVGVLEVTQPAVVVLGHDAFTRERMLVNLAQRFGAPVVSLLHGGFGPAYSFRGLVGDADRVCVWGENDLHTLTQAGVAQARLRVVGSLQHKVSALQAATVGSTESDAPVAWRALGVPEHRPLILFLTASINAGLAHAAADPRRHRDAWREVLQLARARPNLSFAIKPHPSYDHFEFYAELGQDAPANVVLLKDVPLETALSAASAAVLVSYCTTAGLNALIAGLPLVYLKTAAYEGPEWRDSLDQGGAATVRSAEALATAIDRLLSDAVYRTQLRTDGAAAIARAIDRQPVPAVDRVMREVRACALEVGASHPPRGLIDLTQRQLLRAFAVALRTRENEAALEASWRALARAIDEAEAKLPGSGEPLRLGAVYAVATSVVDHGGLVRRLALLDGDSTGLRHDRPTASTMRAEIVVAALARFLDHGLWDSARRCCVHLALRERAFLRTSSVARRLVVKAIFADTRALHSLLVLGMRAREWLRVARPRMSRRRPAAPLALD